jgi:hypothetical protein
MYGISYCVICCIDWVVRVVDFFWKMMMLYRFLALSLALHVVMLYPYGLDKLTVADSISVGYLPEGSCDD